MRQGRVLSDDTKESSRREEPSTSAQAIKSPGRMIDSKRKDVSEEEVEKKPRVDLNFGLDSDEED